MTGPGRTDVPRCWLLLGRKAGDNAQLRALAGALGWPAEEKRIVARGWELLPQLALRNTLLGIDRAASSPIEAPWPDLVMSAGRRNEPVARWIRDRSGGRARLVHLGRPWARLEHWDCVITTPQYFLPRDARVVHNRLPLCDPPAAGLGEEAAGHWARHWRELPRPWIALLIGGDSGKFVLSAAKGRRLGVLANRIAERNAGSLLVTDSARTPVPAAQQCLHGLTVPRWIHRAGEAHENPYRAYLALADAFIVTGESMSMLAEAASRDRPLYVFDLEDEPPWWRHAHAWRRKPLSYHLAMRFAPRRFRRDIGRIQASLIDSGRACWFDEDSAEGALHDAVPGSGRMVEEDLRRAADAVRALFHRSSP